MIFVSLGLQIQPNPSIYICTVHAMFLLLL
jgi:hypothetical protein